MECMEATKCFISFFTFLKPNGGQWLWPAESMNEVKRSYKRGSIQRLFWKGDRRPSSENRPPISKKETEDLFR